MLLSVIMVLMLLQGNAQVCFAPYEALFSKPKNCVVSYTNRPLVVDGQFAENAWEGAAWAELFTNIESNNKPQTKYKTKIKMLLAIPFCLWRHSHREQPSATKSYL